MDGIIWCAWYDEADRGRADASGSAATDSLLTKPRILRSAPECLDPGTKVQYAGRSKRSRFTRRASAMRWPMKALSVYVASFWERALALFHRTDQLKSQSAERKQRWNQVIAEYQKPLGQGKPAGKTDLPRS